MVSSSRRVIFVCLGNICRSPAAAGVFASRAAECGLDVTVDSAGTSRAHLGESPHEHTRGEARRRAIDVDHRARQFTVDDFAAFDVIVAMDRANVRDVLRLAPDDAARAKVRLLRVEGADVEVPDPWGRPAADYAAMFELLDDACRALVTDVATDR